MPNLRESMQHLRHLSTPLPRSITDELASTIDRYFGCMTSSQIFILTWGNTKPNVTIDCQSFHDQANTRLFQNFYKMGLIHNECRKILASISSGRPGPVRYIRHDTSSTSHIMFCSNAPNPRRYVDCLSFSHSSYLLSNSSCHAAKGLGSKAEVGVHFLRQTLRLVHEVSISIQAWTDTLTV